MFPKTVGYNVVQDDCKYCHRNLYHLKLNTKNNFSFQHKSTIRYLVGIVFLYFFIGKTNAQCVIGNVSLNSQTEVTDFIAQYGNCNYPIGDLTINTPVNDISGLNFINELQGTLKISSDSLMTLDGLEQLQSVDYLEIISNENLVSIAALNQVTALEGHINIIDNPNLPNLNGLDHLVDHYGDITISGNEILNSIAGLNQLTTVYGSLTISDHPNLTSLDGLEQLQDVGSLYILNNAIDSVIALGQLSEISNTFSIIDNNLLTSLDGLEELEYVGFELEISGNDVLSNCNGICNFLDLNIAGVTVNIFDNPSECSSKSEVQFLCNEADCFFGDVLLLSQNDVNVYVANYRSCDTIFGNLIIQNAISNIAGLDSIVHVTGNVEILETNLTNLFGLHSLKSIGGNFEINQNELLTNINALDSLTEIGNNFYITNNSNLLELTGLENLTTVGGNFSVNNNNTLTDCSVVCDLINNGVSGNSSFNNNPSQCSSTTEVTFLCDPDSCSTGNITLLTQAEADAYGISYPNCDTIFGELRIYDVNDLSGLSNVKYILGDLEIYSDTLTNLQGLNQLKSVGGRLYIYNADRLESLDGLEQLEEIGNRLIISSNDSLKSIAALSLIDTIPNRLQIIGNPKLLSLTGLDQLKRVGNKFEIRNNESLTTLSGLDSLKEVNGSFELLNNISLVDIQPLEGVEHIFGSFKVIGNINLSDCAVICEMMSNYVVQFNNYTIEDNLVPCGSVSQVSFTCSETQCYEGDVIISSQDDLNTYTDSHPDCDTIFGDLIIYNANDLSELSNIKYIQDDLEIYSDDLITLQGLNQLNFIGGELEINNADLLENIDGLEGLEYIGDDVNISYNDSLKSIAGLSQIDTLTSLLLIRDNPKLVTLNGFNQLLYVGDKVEIRNNESLNSIENLGKLKNIGGRLNITNNEKLETLAGLDSLKIINGQLDLVDNESLTDIQQLEGLENINGSLILQDNFNLSNCEVICEMMENNVVQNSYFIEDNLVPCGSLTQVSFTCSETDCYEGDVTFYSQDDVIAFTSSHPDCDTIKGNLRIEGNVNDLSDFSIKYIQGYFEIDDAFRLKNLSGLDELNTIEGYLEIRNCDSLINLTGLGQLENIEENITISYNPQLTNLMGLGQIENLPSYLLINNNNSLINLQGLEHLKTIGGYLYVSTNSSLTNFEGLENLESIGENLWIGSNQSLQNMTGLDQLYSIENELVINNNNAITNLQGLGNLQEVGDYVQINGNNSLLNLTGLEGLQTIGGDFSIQHNDLISTLEGVDQLSSVGGNLEVSYNESLSDCTTLCPIIFNANVSGTITINNNLFGCNSVAEINSNCTPNDIRPIAVNTSFVNCASGLDGISVSVVIENIGVNPQENFEVGYSFNGAPEVIETVSNVMLAGFDTMTYTFATPAVPTNIGQNEVTVYTLLDNDEKLSNDTIIGSTLVFSNAIETPTGLIPTNESSDISFPISLSWLPSTGSVFYNIYLWKEGTPIPDTPMVKELSGINYLLQDSIFAPGDTVNWYVEANNLNCNVSSAVQFFVMKKLPDLIVENISATTNPSSGGTIAISWDIRNAGTGATGATQWVDAAYLSSDENFIPLDDVYLGSVPNVTSLSQGGTVGDSYSNFAEYTLPLIIDGPHYVYILTDTYDNILESEEDNNIQADSIFINLTPPPDLQVTNVLIDPTGPFSGQEVTITWEVTNTGTGPTINNLWWDRIYLSEEENLNIGTAFNLGDKKYDDNFLQAGESYTFSKQVELPNGISGNYYVHIYTDIHNNAFEYIYDDNNTGTSLPVNITLAPSPNLVVTNISAPDSLSNRETTTIHWTVKNQGFDVAQSNWRDRIYLSTYHEYHPDSIIAISAKLRTADLGNGANEFYTTQRSIITPTNFDAGIYYIYVVTDDKDDVYESIFESDNWLRSDSIYISNPDLFVSEITYTPTNPISGEALNIDWVLENIGIGNVISGTNRTRIFISPTPQYILGESIEMWEGDFNNFIASGGSILKNKEIIIPDDLFGSYYLIIQSDELNQYHEVEGGGENNNFTSVPIEITLGNSADLQVVEIEGVPSMLTAGTKIPLSFTIQNNGDEAILNGNWKDQLYISAEETWNPFNAKKLVTYETVQSLGIGETYETQDSVIIPMLPSAGQTSGVCYLYVYTDDKDNIYEHLGDNENNVLRSDPIFVSAPPPVDLYVVNSSPLPDTVAAGSTHTLQWEVTNIGSSTAIWDYELWYDAIYVSTLNYFDSTAILIEDFTQLGPVGNEDSYSDLQSFVVPPSLATGEYFFYLVADHLDNNLDGNTNNNIFILPTVSQNWAYVFVNATPAPDLTIQSVQSPTVGITGQPIDIILNIENQGVGAASFNWTDKIYLSTDENIDQDDFIIATHSKSPPLAVGENYTDTLQAFIPNGLSGNLFLISKTNANNSLYESDATNNISTKTIIIENQTPSDLIPIINDHSPNGFVEGAISVNYSIQNIGSFPAFGYRKDLVYLSEDSLLTIDDTVIGEIIEDSTFLTPLLSKEYNFSGNIPGVVPGEYHLIVQTDVLNNILESEELNNQFISSSKIDIQIPELLIGISASVVMENQDDIFYRIEVPDSLAGETLLITLDGDSLNAVNNLFVSFGQIPSPASHDFSSSQALSGYADILIPELNAGTYYLLATGQSLVNANQEIDLLAEIINFQIRSVNANQGGNTGSVTVKLEGAKFEEDMTASLVNPNIGTYIADNIYFINSSAIFATFDLNGAGIDTFDVRLEKIDGEETSLEDGFEIVTGDVGGFAGTGNNGGGFYCSVENLEVSNLVGINYVHPSAMRQNRIVPITIQYGNNGNVDIPTPTRFMLSANETPLGFTTDELSEEKYELFLEFIEVGGPPGVLRPGATGTITVYSFSSSTLLFYIQE